MHNNSDSIININGLSYTYFTWNRRPGFKGAVLDIFRKEQKKIDAVKDLTMQIKEKSIAGFLGPNGSGKSTLIKILAGILFPTQGNATVMNYIPWRQRKALARNIGVIFGNRTHLWPDPPVYDSLRMISHMYDVSKQEFKRRIESLGQLLDTTQWLNRAPRTLSLGQRMRCDLMAALIHQPAVLFLDEPTLGVDVATRFLFHRYLKDIRNTFNTTIILASHEIYDVEFTCDTIFLFHEGVLMDSAPTSGFFMQTSEIRQITVILDPAVSQPQLAGLNSIEGIMELKYIEDSNKIEIVFNNTKGKLSVLAEYIFSQYKVMDFIVEEPSVEELLRNRLAKLKDNNADVSRN